MTQILLLTIPQHCIFDTLFVVSFLCLLCYHIWVVRQKNKAISRVLQKLMRYRTSHLNARQDSPVQMEENEQDDVNDETRDFWAMDRRIVRERLFTNPEFGRDELMRLFGVDKNVLATLVQQYAGTNVAGYVNSKRMEYAVELMKEHPEYSLKAIGEACGIISATTFIRNFKNTYGMTPSEYRRINTILPPPRSK